MKIIWLFILCPESDIIVILRLSFPVCKCPSFSALTLLVELIGWREGQLDCQPLGPGLTLTTSDLQKVRPAKQERKVVVVTVLKCSHFWIIVTTAAVHRTVFLLSDQDPTSIKKTVCTVYYLHTFYCEYIRCLGTRLISWGFFRKFTPIIA